MVPGEEVNGGSKRRSSNPDAYLWLERMADKGWTVPTLLEYGSEDQKQRHLPREARGEVAWCQGFSEPGAGSDLASLQTQAEDKGDFYLVSGSKIWTSGAQHAEWIFCLVRTDRDVPKHEGISFVLFSMDEPGITVKPIELINGHSPFCQVFFDDVKVLKQDLGYQMNKGWTVAKRLLQHERLGLAALASAATAGPLERIQPELPLPDLAKHYCGGQRIEDAALRRDIIDNEMQIRTLVLTQQRSVEESEANTPGATTSVFKYVEAEYVKTQLELQMRLRGIQGLSWSGENFTRQELAMTRLMGPIQGPLWAGRNWSADDGAGSIHDDRTAEQLGFRGGTVAGDVHMNQFPPVLVRVFGERWFESGNLSLSFKNATVDGEKVQVFAEPPAPGANQTKVWMEREDGMLVCVGTAALGDHSRSELRRKDLRPCDPAELRILNRVHPGMSLGEYEVYASPNKQHESYDRGLISDPMSWYRDASPWGDVVAAPSAIIQYLWGNPIRALEPYIEGSVGLFGAIEIGYTHGPFLLNRNYRLTSEVICVGQSPRTEYVWYETHAYNEPAQLVATMRMQGRSMKASSAAYQS